MKIFMKVSLCLLTNFLLYSTFHYQNEFHLLCVSKTNERMSSLDVHLCFVGMFLSVSLFLLFDCDAIIFWLNLSERAIKRRPHSTRGVSMHAPFSSEDVED